ncbi:MAG: hypothetical protein JO295_03450 [Verrucomicrobia bacterium]|nr:hypothetical protein [Verrucomicrobiota bacterium]
MQPAVAGTTTTEEDTSKERVPPTEAPEHARRFYMRVGVGTDFDYTATRFSGSASVAPPVGASNSTFPTNVRRQHFSDVYPYSFDTAFYRPEVELGYVLNSHVEIFGMFKYTRADSRPFTVGDAVEFGAPIVQNGVFVGAPATTTNLRASFGDYRSYGGEIGLRYFFLPPAARLRPYVSLAGGATYVESIGVQFSTDTAGTIFSGHFYGNSWIGTVSFLAGLEFAVTPCFSIGLESGIRYESALKRDGGDLLTATVGSAINDSGDRLFAPLNLYAKFRF